MPYAVIFLLKAKKYLVKLDLSSFEQIEGHLEELKEDPSRRRPLADIKKLGGFKSPAVYSRW